MTRRLTLLLLTALLAQLKLAAQLIQTSDMATAETVTTGTDTLATDTATAAQLPFPQCVSQRLDTLLAGNGLLERSQVGLMVYDLTADSAIYTYNHRQTMRPASTQKLVTAIAAIDRLGGDYLLRTTLYHTGTISDRTLRGNLVCVGGMDPAFSQEDLRAMAQGVRALGVDTLRGSIVGDRSFKDGDLLGEGWCWDDDNPQLSPLLVGKSCAFEELFAQALRGSGIVIVGDTMATGGRPRPATAGMQQVASRTHTLTDVLTRMMKESDNLYAEALFYQLAAAGGNRPAKAVYARRQIEELIQRVGLSPADYRIADGSGLSLYNYLSPQLHVRLLRYAYRKPALFACLLPSLPIAGEDGTLKSRMKGTAAASNVRAKTGTVTGVSSLAGYCTAANGHDLCFAIMNQGVMKPADARAFQDRVCRAICASATLSLAQATAPPAPLVVQKAQRTHKPRKPQTLQKNTKRKKRWKR